jgi:hypothetical protein
MARFKVYVHQWVREVATIEVAAESREAAIEEASGYSDGYDFEWSDGNDSKDFAVLGAEEIAEAP